MLANKNTSHSKKKKSVSDDNATLKKTESVKSSKILTANNITNLNRGTISTKTKYNLPSPPSVENDHWPSINSSQGILKKTGVRKNKYFNTPSPVQHTKSFKVALCANTTIENKPKPIQIETKVTVPVTKPKLDIKSEINDTNENEWISVSNKRKNKVAEKEAIIVPNPQQIADKKKKKEELKYKKRLLREQKVKEERDLKSRNTRINVVSQEVLDSYFAQSSSRSNVPKCITFKESTDKSEKIPQNNISNEEKSSKKENKNNPSYKIPISAQQQIVKKKVKTKDLISLNIFDLLKKSGKKAIVPIPIIKKEKTIIKEKPGKQSEVKRDKKSKLKKNIIRQKKINTENFGRYLTEIFKENLIKEDNCIFPTQMCSSISVPERNIHVALIPEPEMQQLAIVPKSEELAIVPQLQELTIVPKLQETVPNKVICENEKEENSKVSKDEDTDAPKVDEFCLKSFHTDLIKEINYLSNPIHSRKFREYCNHFITAEINGLLTEFIELIVKFQIRLYENDPIKGKTKQRFYCGLKESCKHSNKLTCVVLAPDIKCNSSAAGLNDLLTNILSKCETSNTSVIFGLNQFKLGRLTRRKANVTCIGITNFQGAQDVHKKLMEAVCVQKEKYQNANISLI